VFRTSFADRELVRAETGEIAARPSHKTLSASETWMNTTGTVLQDRYHTPNDRCVDHNNCFQTFTGGTLLASHKG
jgi:hypothetical protein